MDFNNNERQKNFNQIKGSISEFNPAQKFCSITLEVGHEKKRFINFVVKKEKYEDIIKAFNIGDKVCVTFYVTSKKNPENGKWGTMVTLLNIELTK